MSREPRVTILLVTWNSLGSVRELLAAVRAFTREPYDLVVVDNASTDGTLDLLRGLRGAPGFRLVENPGNVRCAAATNQAIALARTEYVIYLCASHALVTRKGWDTELLRFMDENPQYPIAGCVWNPYGFLLPSRRYKPGWGPERIGRERLRHVQGGAWVARRSVFEDHGPFAEDEYPHGGMDVEFSYRLLSHGLELGDCPSITSPPSPEVPEPRAGIGVYHLASPELRAEVLSRLAGDGSTGVHAARSLQGALLPHPLVEGVPRRRVHDTGRLE